MNCRDTNLTDCLSKALLNRAVQLEVSEVQHFALEIHQQDNIQKLGLSHLSCMFSQTDWFALKFCQTIGRIQSFGHCLTRHRQGLT